MQLQQITYQQATIAHIASETAVITDIPSALQAIMAAKYQYNTNCMVIAKTAINERFFHLSTGFAGELLQKFSNYRTKVAIYGDFSQYTSKPLRDFIYESNHGNAVFFTPTVQQACATLYQYFCKPQP